MILPRRSLLTLTILLALAPSLARAADPGDDPSYAIELTPAELAHGLTIRDEAPTLPALIAKVHPAATWDDCNLLWVKEVNGRIQSFVVDAVYHIKTADGTSERVTFRSGDGPFDPVEYFRVRAPVIKGGAFPFAFARELLNSRHRGRLFEINWPGVNTAASASNIQSRRVFVLRSPDAHWSVLGECEGDSSSIDGFGGGYETLTTSAVWTDNPDAPVRISLHKTSVAVEVTNDHDPPPIPSTDLQTHTRGILVGTAVHWFPETLTLNKKDTLDTIAYRLAFWLAGGGRDNPDFQWAIDRWKEALLRANPALAHLKTKHIPSSFTVTVPDYLPIYQALIDRFPTTQPSPAK